MSQFPLLSVLSRLLATQRTRERRRRSEQETRTKGEGGRPAEEGGAALASVRLPSKVPSELELSGEEGRSGIDRDPAFPPSGMRTRTRRRRRKTPTAAASEAPLHRRSCSSSGSSSVISSSSLGVIEQSGWRAHRRRRVELAAKSSPRNGTITM